MELTEAMLLWNNAADHDCLMSSHKRRRVLSEPEVRVKIVRHRGRDTTREYDYLAKSLWACCNDWKPASHEYRLMQMFKMFNELVTKSGLISDEVHRAFLEIDEYMAHSEGVKRCA
jgi:hypothetical protein